MIDASQRQDSMSANTLCTTVAKTSQTMRDATASIYRFNQENSNISNSLDSTSVSADRASTSFNRIGESIGNIVLRTRSIPFFQDV